MSNIVIAYHSGNHHTESVALEVAKGAEAGLARILRYDNTLIDIEAVAPAQGGFLVLNDVWQNWQAAYLDGRPAPILRANLMFRAVMLSPGPHRLRFRFEPFRAFSQFLPRAASRVPPSAASHG